MVLLQQDRRSTRQKSSSRTKLPDGTFIREDSTLERHQVGRTVQTTTRVETTSSVKWLWDGSSVLENTTVTTTTQKECIPQSTGAACAAEAIADAMPGCHGETAGRDDASSVEWTLDSAESSMAMSMAPEEEQVRQTKQNKERQVGSQISFFHKTHPSSKQEQAEARDDEIESDLRRTVRAGDDDHSSNQSGRSRSAADGSDSSAVSSRLPRFKMRPRSVTPSQRLSKQQGRSLNSGNQDKDGKSKFRHDERNRSRNLNESGGGDDGVRQALEYMGKVKSKRVQPDNAAVLSLARQKRFAETNKVPATTIVNNVSLADCLDDETRDGTYTRLNRLLLPASPFESPKSLVLKHYGQALLDGSAPASCSPKVAIHGANAVVVASNQLHFYALDSHSKLWRVSTTVNLSNTRDISIALHSNVAVIGLPHDRDKRQVLTGAAYIFEKDETGSATQPAGWTQVKKIVPKKVHEHATVGYSVDVYDNMVAIGVPGIGGRSKGGGAVYTYARVDKFIWSPIGEMRPESRFNAVVDPATELFGLSNFGSKVALRNNTMVVSDYAPNSGDTDFLCSISVYEYSGEAWTPIQTDLLSTEGRQKFFGSSLCLTDDGTGLLVGSTPNTSPSEILYFRRDCRGREFELHSVVAPIEQYGIISFARHGDLLVLGTVREQVNLYKINAADGRWVPILKAEDSRIDGFGQCLALHGDRMLVGSNGNVFSHSLGRWAKHQQRSGKKKGSRSKRATGLGFGKSPLRTRQRDVSAPRRRLLSSLSPLRRR